MSPEGAARNPFINIVDGFKAATACVRADEQCGFGKDETMLEWCGCFAMVADASRFVTKTRERSRWFSKLLRHLGAREASTLIM